MTQETAKIKVAIIGSGNIGTDLMIKVMRTAKHLEMGVFVGIDPNSDGLARAQRMGVATTHEGIDGLLNHPLWPEIGYVFDATSAKAHLYNYEKIKAFEGKRVIDLTPAAIGPFLVPPVNFDTLQDVPNVNMVQCKHGDVWRTGNDPYGCSG
ncbi:MAG: Acetaldehyde dehydrogenase [Bacteroidota bacterium]